MDDARIGTALRAIRLRRGLTQRAVGRPARVSASTVSRIERGQAGGVAVDRVRAVCRVLDAVYDARVRWRGGDLDRLVSGRHAALGEVATRRIQGDAWEVRPEVSFALGGERGVIDLLAWHDASRTLLVVELKTELVDVGETLGTLDRKARLAARIAGGLGWVPASIGVVLVLAEGPTNRRRAATFRATLGAALPSDGRTVAAWLRHPRGDLRGVIFLSLSHQVHAVSGITARKRAPTARSRRSPHA